MHPNVQSVTLPKGARNNPRVAEALAELNRDIARFFEFNGARPVYVRAVWRGRYYAVRATYPATGGQTMTLATRCT